MKLWKIVYLIGAGAFLFIGFLIIFTEMTNSAAIDDFISLAVLVSAQILFSCLALLAGIIRDSKVDI